MSSTDSSGEDHAYFQAIEETFVRLRGAPLLLSPADWRVASEWRRQGVPLELVLATLETVFRQRTERGAGGRIQGLRYVAKAVEEAWSEHSELVATGTRLRRGAIDIEARLRALTSALPVALEGRQRLVNQIRGLRGSPEEVEQSLMDLDRETVGAAAAALEEEERGEISRQVEAALSKLEARVAATDRDRFRERLYRDAVRRRAGLPLLSLFAPEAAEPG